MVGLLRADIVGVTRNTDFNARIVAQESVELIQRLLGLRQDTRLVGRKEHIVQYHLLAYFQRNKADIHRVACIRHILFHTFVSGLIDHKPVRTSLVQQCACQSCLRIGLDSGHTVARHGIHEKGGYTHRLFRIGIEDTKTEPRTGFEGKIHSLRRAFLGYNHTLRIGVISLAACRHTEFSRVCTVVQLAVLQLPVRSAPFAYIVYIHLRSDSFARRRIFDQHVQE